MQTSAALPLPFETRGQVDGRRALKVSHHVTAQGRTVARRHRHFADAGTNLEHILRHTPELWIFLLHRLPIEGQHIPLNQMRVHRVNPAAAASQLPHLPPSSGPHLTRLSACHARRRARSGRRPRRWRHDGHPRCAPSQGCQSPSSHLQTRLPSLYVCRTQRICELEKRCFQWYI